jgi:hypothetical protein
MATYGPIWRIEKQSTGFRYVTRRNKTSGAAVSSIQHLDRSKWIDHPLRKYGDTHESIYFIMRRDASVADIR